VTDLTRLFVPAVNAGIGALMATAAVACNLHHVAVIHEVRRERQALCAAKLEALQARNNFLGATREAADKCAALEQLSGEGS
jgi:hypothetical protein